jgi:uncharacterized membrane protein YcaP (DUF421 family)
MNPEEIKLGDWSRIFFGEAPAGFFVELVIRCFVIFILLVVAMRIFGKRLAGQVNRIEMIALFSLAAAIGVPLQAPDRGLLPAFGIAVIVIIIGKLIASIAFKNQRFEQVVEDEFSTVVKDGYIQMKGMKQSRLTIERLYAQLRSEGIRHLGEVKRLYFEANGSFSLVKYEQPIPGLVVIPGYDDEFISGLEQTNQKVCNDCGFRQAEQSGKQECENCGNNHWDSGFL